jgi:hypothetical protein
MKQLQTSRSMALLSMLGQHLAAGRRKLGTILLQASQNGKIALIHQFSAKARNVTCACLLLFVSAAVLSHRAGWNRCEQRECDEKFEHLSSLVLTVEVWQNGEFRRRPAIFSFVVLLAKFALHLKSDGAAIDIFKDRSAINEAYFTAVAKEHRSVMAVGLRC